MKELQNYEKACNELKDAFLKKLYPKDSFDDFYWIGDCVGEVGNWGDLFVHANDMANFFRYKLTPDEFFEWYDQAVKNKCGGLNMKQFKLKL